MEYQELHSWDVTPTEAVEIQKKLREQVKIQKLSGKVRYIAGADMSFEKFSNIVYAGFVVIDVKTLEVVGSSTIVTEAKFPYISGLFSFREVPPLLEAWKKLDVEPDVVVLDGQGIAHPRRFGLASHIGLIINKPTIGCAKTVLVGKYHDLAPYAGSTAPLMDRGEQIGMALRTQNRVRPVFISVGHLIDLVDALKVIKNTIDKYRIPTPTREAHLLVNRARVDAGASSIETEDEEES
ncbi:MAG: deoxyribonuclease V [Acidobacteria bacterium]|nr:deoxyribonuclease V [Acidobacteriota bacterium]